MKISIPPDKTYPYIKSLAWFIGYEGSGNLAWDTDNRGYWCFLDSKKVETGETGVPRERINREDHTTKG